LPLISHFETEQATFYLWDRNRNVLLNSGKEILLAFSFFVLLRELKGKKKKVHFRLTANKSAL